MSHLSIEPPQPPRPPWFDTIDIFHHPLAAEGLYPRYRIVGYPADPEDEGEPCRNASMEVLVDQKMGAEFMAEVEAAGAAAGCPGPACEAATDHGGGPWQVIEVLGPRAMILELMLVAQRLGGKRMPFPG